jgi:hypothetical protein
MNSTTINETGQGGLRNRVSSAIQLASARTGVDFSYLFAQARIESGLNPNARARTSSATGLFQFIEQTWLGTVKQHGADHGLGWAAQAIRRGPDGRYRVADPAMRRAILDLRRQPEAAAAMAGAFASDNRNYLENRLGRSAEPVDLYLAHFLGPAGAAGFLRAFDANPNRAAASVVPAAARANRWVFYNRDGSPRSLAQIRERFAARIGGGGTNGPATSPSVNPLLGAPVRTASRFVEPEARVAGPSPQYARLAYLMLAQLGG